MFHSHGVCFDMLLNNLSSIPVYDHIVWTPCLAHTVNLMLKDIDRRPEHAITIKQRKRISNWLHNHGQLNTMIRNIIGGELVKWNANSIWNQLHVPREHLSET